GIKEVFYSYANDRFGGCGSDLGVNAKLDHPIHPFYNAPSRYCWEEAIMSLRRFISPKTQTASHKLLLMLKFYCSP
ncbi:hypothetical protein BDQ17DRAFT_1241024, partial [Cyathus striatus]